MWAHYKVLFACLVTCLTLVDSSELIVRNPPGYSSLDTIDEVRSRLDAIAARSESRVLYDNFTSLNHQVSDKILYEYKNENVAQSKNEKVAASAGIKITCTRCYTRGLARAKLTVNGEFNATQVTTELKQETKKTFDAIRGFASNISDVVEGNVKNLTFGEIADELERVPPPQIDFNLNFSFPGYDLDIEFEDAELYVELKTTLSSGLTYTLNIFTSRNTGIQLDKSLLLGVVFSIDLILSVESEIDISSGFHIKLDDKVRMKMALFAKEASDLTFNGGRFEFLPVIIESENVVLRALLRLQVRAGFTLSTFDLQAQVGGRNLRMAAGIEARAYVIMADLVTNVTAKHGQLEDAKDCSFQVVQDYKLAVGAAAGATVELLGTAFGPTPATEVPIYYTTLAAVCLTKGRARDKTVAAEVYRRASGGSTTTTQITSVYEATACMSLALINCPASLQTISRNTVTKTLTATITSGTRAIWSTPAVAAFTAVDFRGDALSFKGSSGAPKSYVPPSPATTSERSHGQGSESSQAEAETDGVSNQVIIGVSVGLGVPIVLAIISGIYLLVRRRRAVSTMVSEQSELRIAEGKDLTRVAYSPVKQDVQ